MTDTAGLSRPPGELVEAEQGDRQLQPTLLQRPDGADGDQVLPGQQRRRRVGQPEQLAHGAFGDVDAAHVHAHQARVECDPRGR
jgi:hypothetical protein